VSNLFFLSNGLNFIVNPALEVSHLDARNSKKLFLLSLNPVDLSTDKFWTSKAIAALATGLVPIKGDNTTRATKAVLIDRLKTYIQEERLAASIVDETAILYARQTLSDCSLNTDRLVNFIKTLQGQDLVDSISSLILSNNYAPSTIVKTILPEVSKLLGVYYKETDGFSVRGSLYARFKALRESVNETTKANVAKHCKNRQITDWSVVTPFVNQILDNIDTVSWKHLSVALAISTGRRQAEVHSVSTTFEYVNESTVRFEGQLKTKTRGQVDAYEIPCLFDPTKVITAWQKLKSLGKCAQPEDINRLYSKALSGELPLDIKAFKLSANLTAYKDNRDLYAAYCVTQKPVTVSANAYLSRIMGHSEDDLSTATTYDKRGVLV
jgi:hypothetical protein